MSGKASMPIQYCRPIHRGIAFTLCVTIALRQVLNRHNNDLPHEFVELLLATPKYKIEVQTKTESKNWVGNEMRFETLLRGRPLRDQSRRAVGSSARRQSRGGRRLTAEPRSENCGRGGASRTGSIGAVSLAHSKT